MLVVKASGETEKFDPNKIRETCLRAGASKDLTEKVVREVIRKAYDGITTKEILDLILHLLNKEKPFVAIRYDLKGALFRLGPAGFAFEHLLSEILREYGYTTKVHSILKGACIDHEVDVIAIEKVGPAETRSYMIEAKYHNLPGVYTGVKDALYTYARFLDLREGWKNGKCEKLDVPWLACNTKFSGDTIQYAECVGLKLIGWKYPEGKSLERLIEDKRLYPITMLKRLDKDSQDKMALSGLVLAKDLITKPINRLAELTGIQKSKLEIFKEEAEKLLLF